MTSGSPPEGSTRSPPRAIAGYDKIVGLRLGDVSLDGSLHKSPCGGEETARLQRWRGELGWKWWILADLSSMPFGWASGGADRHDSILLEPTLDEGRATGWSATSGPSGSIVAMAGL